MTNHFLRKRIWLTVVGLALALALACAPQAQRTPTAPREEPKTAAQEKPAPKYGGVLVWAPIKARKFLHPFVGGTTDILRHTAVGYETLVAFEAPLDGDERIDLKVIPWLAESWEQPDEKTYVFHLRRGVKWHDGEEFTAEDVVATYNWVNDAKNGVTFARARLKDVESLQAMDRYTVKISLKAPSALFVDGLADENLLILPKRAFEQDWDLNKVLIGTGPFKLKSFEADKESIWVKNEDYWQKGRPYPDGVKQIWGLDASAMMAAFITGKNDLLALSDQPQLDALLKNRPDAQYINRITDMAVGYYPKLDRPPFNDLRVRRALHLTLDRQAMVQTLTFGKGIINPPIPGMKTGWAIPQEELLKMPGYRQPKDADIAEAKRLLAEAGYPNGFETTLLYQGEGIAQPPIAQMVATQALKVGIKITLDPQQTSTYRDREAKGLFDAVLDPMAAAELTGRFVDRFHSKGGANKNGLADPKLDQLIDGVQYTADVEQRKKITRELQLYMLEQLYYLPTIDFATFGVYQPWVHDYYFKASTAITPHRDNYFRIWLDKDKIPAGR